MGREGGGVGTRAVPWSRIFCPYSAPILPLHPASIPPKHYIPPLSRPNTIPRLSPAQILYLAWVERSKCSPGSDLKSKRQGEAATLPAVG